MPLACFNCNQPRNYTTHCPAIGRSKAPAVNIITAEVQQVTAHSKAQRMQWKVQDEVWQATKDWIEKANNANVDSMNIEMKDITIDESPSSHPTDLLDDDPTWQALACYQISMLLNKLLHLLP